MLRTVENPSLVRCVARWGTGTLCVDLPDVGRVEGETRPTGEVLKVIEALAADGMTMVMVRQVTRPLRAVTQSLTGLAEGRTDIGPVRLSYNGAPLEMRVRPSSSIATNLPSAAITSRGPPPARSLIVIAPRPGPPARRASP